MGRKLIPVLEWTDGPILYRGSSVIEAPWFRLDAPGDVWTPIARNPGSTLVRTFSVRRLGDDGWPLGGYQSSIPGSSGYPSLFTSHNAGVVMSTTQDVETFRSLLVDILHGLRLIEPMEQSIAESGEVQFALRIRLIITGRNGALDIDGPSFGPWRTTWDDEAFALLGQPGPALWPWDRLQEFAEDCGIPVREE